MNFDSNSDVIDSRDVIDRIEELVALRAANIESMESFGDDDCEDFTSEDAAELAALEALASEGENLSDWHFGVTLVNDDHFEDYAEQLAGDLGMIDSDAGWPACHIDWEAAATSLQQDYTSVEFWGTTFWAR